MWHGCRAPIRSRQHSAPSIPAARGREANPGGGGASPLDPRWIRLAGMIAVERGEYISCTLTDLALLASRKLCVYTWPAKCSNILTLGRKKQASGSNVLDVVYVAAGTGT
ncbi:uncharacterized protein LOC110434330 [Sorghum bicolor]|uniref:uncharacterized protein LOC110434330 n=1 Tax=Sorghum bicolor TaxID=4558 RepID=UPI000B4254B1|nr:uncharacterized protein LOC110434330 [Sorghum bicolor]|eukprot:XP_021313865.1 uncharacterized protein LOC110434330 [Sorghum bicolor]